MPRFILLFISVFFCFLNSHAQQILKTGGSSNSTFLFGSVAYARKTQCIYPPSSLSNETNGTIKRLYFKYGSTGATNDQVLTDFKVKLGITNDQTIPGTTFYTDLTTALDTATYTIPGGSAGTWFAIEVDSTFNYDASRSLIVEVSFSDSEVQNWGTFGTSNTPARKLNSPDVDATTGSNTSSTWQDMGFDLSTITGLSPQISFETGIGLWPNPATDFIAFTLKDQNMELARFAICSSDGKCVARGDVMESQMLVDVKSLPAGLYTAEVIQGSRRFHGSFVKK
ncbi:MAG TPA: hypothetical protein PK509_17030 [Catalimonadaceae bacterium]|nr:hypothetical protein [Catalimonadaceae bacterium]